MIREGIISATGNEGASQGHELESVHARRQQNLTFKKVGKVVTDNSGFTFITWYRFLSSTVVVSLFIVWVSSVLLLPACAFPDACGCLFTR